MRTGPAAWRSHHHVQWHQRSRTGAEGARCEFPTEIPWENGGFMGFDGDLLAGNLWHNYGNNAI